MMEEGLLKRVIGDRQHGLFIAQVCLFESNTAAVARDVARVLDE